MPNSLPRAQEREAGSWLAGDYFSQPGRLMNGWFEDSRQDLQKTVYNPINAEKMVIRLEHFRRYIQSQFILIRNQYSTHKAKLMKAFLQESLKFTANICQPMHQSSTRKGIVMATANNG